MLSEWISSHGLDDGVRSTIARVNMKNKHTYSLASDSKKTISFSPWKGSFLFWYRDKLLSYNTRTINEGLHTEEVISITCCGRSAKVIKDLFNECRNTYLEQHQSKTNIFRNRGDYWRKMATKDKRPLSSIIIGDTQKQKLVADVQDFLNPATRNWYSKRTIPCRRGFLFYGPPGTGKSSLGAAVAGEFNLDVYIVTIPDVDDRALEDLFHELPESCVVLLEDIDAVGADRSYDPSGCQKKMLSLSGLLNTLDGVGSQEGRILIMTTNHIDKLDHALIRPGRIDMKIEFTLADSIMAAQLFEFIFTPDDTVKQKSEAESAKDELADFKQMRDESSKIHSMAEEFAALVPESVFSTAKIMSYLLHHRQSPHSALREAKEWVELMLHAKERLNMPLDAKPRSGAKLAREDFPGNMASPPLSLRVDSNPMKTDSPDSHDVMNAKLHSESSSIISRSSASGSKSGTEDTESTVYDGDDEMNSRDVCVDTGLSPIPDELRRLWNFAENRKITSPVPHSSPSGINDRADESAHSEDGRLGADGASTETESTPSGDLTSVAFEEGIWMREYKRASLKEPHLETSECCKFHAAGEYASPS